MTLSNHQLFSIAIDGPVSAGKGTISRLVAQELNFLYVDTGAMYRVTALIAKTNNIDYEMEAQILPLLKKAIIEMRNPTEAEKDGRLTTVLLDKEDVSWKIRTEEMGLGASKVALLPKIRQELVKKQQKIAENQNVIMEGRDITYRVLPKSPMKIYLTANDTVRAKRRHLQLQIRGENVSFDEVYKDILERDYRDTHRACDPLKIVDDAWIIDTSDLDIKKVVDIITTKARLLMDCSLVPEL